MLIVGHQQDDQYIKIAMKTNIPKQENLFYLFINTKSGGGWGRRFLEVTDKVLTYKFQKSPTTHLRFIDLLNVEERKSTFLKIVSVVDEQKAQQKTEKVSSGYSKINVRIIICGGDGTVMWVIQQAIDNKLDFQQVVFGILPIGTGNDFSRSLGWGYKEPEISKNNQLDLNKIVQKWVTAKTSFYDIWDVELETYPNGCFYQIKNQVEIKKENKVMRKSFSNYCGMGLEARVVYTVEQHRTINSFMNKVVYACVGMCYLFKSMKQLVQTIDHFKESQNESECERDGDYQNYNEINSPVAHFQKVRLPTSPEGKNIESSNLKTNLLNKKLEQMTKESPYSTEEDSSRREIEAVREEEFDQGISQERKSGNYRLEEISKRIGIKKGYRGIVAVNCPSYMAGLRHVWQTTKIGRKTGQPPHQKFQKQSFNDGRIQFIGFKSQFNLALQRFIRAGARIAQGPGPFEIIMKQPSQQSSSVESYIQIDGESVKVNNLKRITIGKTTKIVNSRIRVLVNLD